MPAESLHPAVVLGLASFPAQAIALPRFALPATSSQLVIAFLGGVVLGAGSISMGVYVQARKRKLEALSQKIIERSSHFGGSAREFRTQQPSGWNASDTNAEPYTSSFSLLAEDPAPYVGSEGNTDYIDVAERYVQHKSFMNQLSLKAKGVAEVLRERLSVHAMDGVPVIERAQDTTQVQVGDWAQDQVLDQLQDQGRDQGDFSFNEASALVSFDDLDDPFVDDGSYASSQPHNPAPKLSLAEYFDEDAEGEEPSWKQHEALWQVALDELKNPSSAPADKQAAETSDQLSSTLSLGASKTDGLNSAPSLQAGQQGAQSRAVFGNDAVQQPDMSDAENYVAYLFEDEAHFIEQKRCMHEFMEEKLEEKRRAKEARAQAQERQKQEEKRSKFGELQDTMSFLRLIDGAGEQDLIAYPAPGHFGYDQRMQG